MGSISRFTFNRIEQAQITYDDGVVRIKEWQRGTEVAWMPSARRALAPREDKDLDA